jgi:metal-responsive CopG/Arc/MetJ family transcriptional regulator
MKVVLNVPDATIAELDLRLAGYSTRAECIREMIRRFISEVKISGDKPVSAGGFQLSGDNTGEMPGGAE